jgi:Ras-related protein Rab-5C
MTNYSAKLMIWDTAGQEKYKSMIKMYYKNANAAIVVFDVTNIQSFEKAQSWVDELLENTNTNTVIALCGNKVDLEDSRKVSYDEGAYLAEKIGAFYIEVSAKKNINVEKMFEDILNRIPFEENIPNEKKIPKEQSPATTNKCSHC